MHLTKDSEAFLTISEVARSLDLPQHILRFWETRFHQIKPMKRAGGRRYYRPIDVELLKGIRYLLYFEGYTIKAVQRIFRERGESFVLSIFQNNDLIISDSMPPEKQAMRVSEIVENESLNKEDNFVKETLHSALTELLECKHLLDRTR
ncbi:MerR family transcriptional regulator [Candidatus Endowatersipora endosymbiont of Watersipora subatra]|uniref:MerR family transcriptional regulator n=1 Tax=Candidatus Endowatersipora endosymbiont of Watersipora subatra TaxID=3077946 RepID=UPI00312C6E31